jgi:hypothetical protein
MLSEAKHLVLGDSSVTYGFLRMTKEMTDGRIFHSLKIFLLTAYRSRLTFFTS